MPSSTTVSRLVARGSQNRPVREFVRALLERETYLPWKNTYAIFGFLWGLPIPFFSVAIDLWAQQRSFAFSIFVEHPVHLLFALHPVLFAVVFGAMGRVRSRKDRHIGTLIGTLRLKIDELEELDRLRSEFVANVTHELKTPLVAIRGYTEMLLEGRLGPVSEKQKNGLETSIRNIDRLQAQIDDLLQLAHVDSGRLKARQETFDLKRLVASCIETFQPRAEAKGVSIETQWPEGPIWVYADADMIGHALSNLVSNSVKFVGHRGHIRISLSNGRGRGVRVTVSDNGCGIPEAALPHVVERFRQADGSSRRQHGGAGLGLSIVKGILDAHATKLKLTSREHEGTCVEFVLPRGERIPT